MVYSFPVLVVTVNGALAYLEQGKVWMVSH